MRGIARFPSGGNRKIAIFMVSIGLITLLSAASIIRNNNLIPSIQGDGQLTTNYDAISQQVHRSFNDLVRRFNISSLNSEPVKEKVQGKVEEPVKEKVQGKVEETIKENVQGKVKENVQGEVEETVKVPFPKPVTEAVPKCVDPHAKEFRRAEDLYCQVFPDLVEEYKNPCFNDVQFQGKTSLKCLPFFYILGMDKCATTDLHSRIATHPDVRGNTGSHDKETKYWSWFRYGIFNYRNINHKWTIEEYFKSFKATAMEIQENTNASRRVITGDATPMDLWDFRFWKQIPQNNGKEEPEVLTPHLVKYMHRQRTPKFLIQLREPVERLYSDYFFLDQGHSPESFHKHVLIALAMFKDCRKKHSERVCLYSRELYQKLPTRIHLGCYSVFIKEWLAVFPMSAFHFTRTEDFRDDMKTTLEGIFSFLSLDPLPVKTMTELVEKNRKHVTANKKGRMLPETFRILKEFYAPYVAETAAILGDKDYLWKDVYEALKDPNVTMVISA